MDELQIKNLRLYAYHGCHAEERKIGAWFSVSLRVFCNMESAIASDELEDALDYVKLKTIIEEEMAIPSNLIEHVAGRIIKRIKELNSSTTIEVEISKEQPPFHGMRVPVSIKIKR
jgi:dihydroneopterin aldolase